MSDRAKDTAWGAVLLVVLGAIGLFLYGKLASYSQTMVVTALAWQRIQPVEVFKVLHKDTDESQMPADAYNISKYTTSHYVSETCSSGTGKNKTTWECGHSETDYMARYDMNRWAWDHDLSLTGSPADEMEWPDFTPDSGEYLGAQRAGQRREILTVWLVTPQGKSYAYNAPDYPTWHSFVVGQKYALNVNRMEEALWDTLKVVDAR